MTWLDFIASTVETIAWPVVVVVLVVLLRKPLAKLLPLLARVTVKGVTVEFAETVRQVRDEANERTRSQPEPAPSTAVQRASQVSPRAAVVEAYRELESGAISKLLSLGGPKCETLSSKGIRTLEDSSGLDRGTVSLLRDLRGLRNEVAHAPKFALSATSASEYADAAARVAAHLASK